MKKDEENERKKQNGDPSCLSCEKYSLNHRVLMWSSSCLTFSPPFCRDRLVQIILFTVNAVWSPLTLAHASLSGLVALKWNLDSLCGTNLLCHQCVIRNHRVFCHFRQPCKSKDRPPAFMIFLLNCSLTLSPSLLNITCLWKFPPHYGLSTHIRADGERSPVLLWKSKQNGLCHGLQEKYFPQNWHLEKLVLAKKCAHILTVPCVVIQKMSCLQCSSSEEPLIRCPEPGVPSWSGDLNCQLQC